MVKTKLAKLAVFELKPVWVQLAIPIGDGGCFFFFFSPFPCVQKENQLLQLAKLCSSCNIALALACQLASCFGPCVCVSMLAHLAHAPAVIQLNLAPNNNGCLLLLPRVSPPPPKKNISSQLFTTKTCKLVRYTILTASQLFMRGQYSVFIPWCLYKRSP